LTLEQISDAMIPRLGRPVYVTGKRDRVAALLSFEYRPSDDLHFYLDTLYAKAWIQCCVTFMGRRVEPTMCQGFEPTNVLLENPGVDGVDDHVVVAVDYQRRL
jgi:hypothetical protein